MKVRLLVPVLSLAMFLICSGVVAAGETSTEERLVASLLEAYPTLSQEEITDLVALGYGYGEIAIAADLAVSADLPLSEIITQAESGLGWGEIADLYGLEDSQFGQNVRQIFAQGLTKTGNANLVSEEALVREMIQVRQRAEISNGTGSAASPKQTRTETEETKQSSSGTQESNNQGSSKGSKGKAS